MTETLPYDILLDLEVLPDEIRTVLEIGHYTAHMCCGKHHGIRLFTVEESFHRRPVQEVELAMGAPDKVRIPPLQEIVPYCGTNQSPVARNIYLGCFFQWFHYLFRFPGCKVINYFATRG